MKKPPHLLTSLIFLLVASLTVTAAVAEVSASPETPELAWRTDLHGAVEAARLSKSYILVDLFAEWCGWCHTLEEKVFTHPNFKKYVEANDLVLLRVDTEDRAEGTWLKARYGAHSLPTTLILDADLVKIGAVSGFAPMPTFVEYLQEQMDGYATILSFYDKVLASDDAELQKKLATDLHGRGDGVRAARLYQRILDRIQQGTDAEAWLTYNMADALRMGRHYESANQTLELANTLAVRLEDNELMERIALLATQVAQDLGDCTRAMATLEHFVNSFPKSIHSHDARRTLQAIRKGEAMECTRGA